MNMRTGRTGSGSEEDPERVLLVRRPVDREVQDAVVELPD
jgi:hypothetical protein